MKLLISFLFIYLMPCNSSWVSPSRRKLRFWKWKKKMILGLFWMGWWYVVTGKSIITFFSQLFSNKTTCRIIPYNFSVTFPEVWWINFAKKRWNYICILHLTVIVMIFFLKSAPKVTDTALDVLKSNSFIACYAFGIYFLVPD